MDPNMTRCDWQNEAAAATFYEDEYYLFQDWLEMIGSLFAIGPAAGRHEVLTLQRKINADVADAKGREGVWILSGWAEDYAEDTVHAMDFAVDHMAAGDMPACLHAIDGMRDLLVKGMDRAEYPREYEG